MKHIPLFLTELLKYQIDTNTPDKFIRLRHIHSILANAHLLTLLTGHGPPPIVEPDVNKFRFSESRVTNILVSPISNDDPPSPSPSSPPQFKEILLQEDDIFKYKYDYERLYSMVYSMFHPHLHHHVTKENQEDLNGVNAYHDMHQHVFGQKQIDIKNAKRALENH